MRPAAKRDDFVKLLYARYFTVSKDHMAIAIGIDRQGAPDGTTYKEIKERLNNMWWILRSKTCGKSSLLSKLSQHIVELHDFKATVFNLARQKRLWETVPPDESVARTTERVSQLALYRNTIEEHLGRLAASRLAAVQMAEAELDALENPNRPTKAKFSEINKARQILEHHRDQNRSWEPSLASSYSRRETVPPEK